MSSPFTIGQLAKKAGASTSSIRYYERLGLLRPIKRSAGDYRLYDLTSFERLSFIKEAQSAGFSLKDIKALLRFRDGSQKACAKVRSVIEHRLKDVEAQMAALGGVRRILLTFLEACQQVESGEECPVLESLTSLSSIPPKKKTGQNKFPPKNAKP